MIKYITSKPLWVNIVAALILVLILIFIFFLSLNWITKHGDALPVPSLVGKSLEDAEKIIEEKGFDLVIQDSVFYDSLPPGFVIRQVPDPDAVVKVNRTIYITINRYVAPDVDMPNLVGYTLRNAELVLRNLGLHIGDTTSRPDFAKNAILEQSFNGRPIAPGEKIKVGSRIDFVVGSGLGTEYMAVPYLIGKTYGEARAMLDAYGLTGVPLPDPDVTDQENAFVYWQSINPKTEDGARVRIRQGQMIDVKLSVQPPVVEPQKQQSPPSQREPQKQEP
ncbi:MAG TPA: PASTA domain-containing protein, partial [Flavisolibacter sp.]